MDRLPVTRPLTELERTNLKRVESAGMRVAYLSPTRTGLSKHLMDAVTGVRELFEAVEFHSYRSQKKGPEHKAVHPAVILAANRVVHTTVSMYRPKTKDGDPRLWVSELHDNSRPGDMLALAVHDSTLVVVNLTTADLDAAVAPRGWLQGVESQDRVAQGSRTLYERPILQAANQVREESTRVTSELPTTVTVEPTPRILQILGHVNFQGWQCIAELVDNAIDAFLRDADGGVDHASRRIDIALPSQPELNSGQGQVQVLDSASGMTLDQIRNACRAGFSGNDPIGKLGLFGMGFNVSTVRLGRVTEILSHRPGDDEWVGIRIDIDEMVRHGSFDAPVITEPVRPDDGVSGTKVRISRIAPDGVVRGMIIGRGRGALTKKLARLYHVASDRHSIDIWLNGNRVPSWGLCLWGEERSVPSQAWGRIPAQFPIDIALSALPYCPNCWEWGIADQEACLLCGGPMTLRERRIHGVLGVQRSFAVAWSEGDKDSYYGIDLIRNGRVIEAFDKDLFYWTDPNDPNRRDLDYPVDAPYLGGRIVGQLEVDFVPLRSYHKDSFEKADRTWSEVREALRGEGPLRPDVARRLGYERTDTPLARLFDGYRKTSPAGERYLVTAQPPGTKSNPRDPMHRGPLLDEWIAGFEGGLDEFQSDERWWEAVRWAEGGGQLADEPVAGTPFDVEPAADDTDSARPDGQVPAAVLNTVDDPSLSVTVSTEGIVRNAPSTIEVRAKRVVGGELTAGLPLQVDPKAYGLDFVWNPRHALFREGIMAPIDALVAEMAFQVVYRAQVTQREYPVASVQAEIQRRAFPQRAASIDAAAERATDMLNALRSLLELRLPQRAPITVDLDPADLADLERAAAGSGIPNAEVARLITAGEFVTYAPVRFLPKSALLFPDVLMSEEGLFGIDYAGYETEQLRAELRESLYSNLLDVTWLVEERPNLQGAITDSARLQVRKALASLELLELKRLS